jgi:hypothetical protein
MVVESFALLGEKSIDLCLLHHRMFCVFFRKQALQAKVEAEKEGIVVPLTLEEYCLKPKANPNNQEPQVNNSKNEKIVQREFYRFLSTFPFLARHDRFLR